MFHVSISILSALAVFETSFTSYPDLPQIVAKFLGNRYHFCIFFLQRDVQIVYVPVLKTLTT
jgi:hypothetical protein